jgi:hypothetical protein
MVSGDRDQWHTRHPTDAHPRSVRFQVPLASQERSTIDLTQLLASGSGVQVEPLSGVLIVVIYPYCTQVTLTLLPVV